MCTAKRSLNWPGQLHRASNATGEQLRGVDHAQRAQVHSKRQSAGHSVGSRRVSVHRRCPLVQW